MPARSSSIAVRRSANHGLFTAAGGVDAGFWLRGAIPLDPRNVQFSLSTVPSENPTAFAVTPRVAFTLALAISILPLNCAEPVNGTDVSVVNRGRSGAFPAISR